MEIPGEDIIPLFANHETMCRLEGATDDGYDYALKAIKRLARTALTNRGMATKTDRTSSNQSLSETEKSCMVLLNSIYLAEYKAQLPRPVQGTCNWVLSHPAYLAWITAEETTLLWVTGEPGCGKTMLSAYLTDHLRLGHATTLEPQVFFFFCDDKLKSQRDANAILRGIIYQLLQQDRKLVRHVKSRFELDGPSLANSFPALWNLFLKIAADSASSTVGVIVDATDECEARTRNNFLTAMMQLVNEPKDMNRHNRNCIKFLITSRPSLGNSYNLTGSMKNRLPIEQNHGNVSEDVKLVIRSKVGEIANKFHCDDETKNHLEKMLNSKSNQSFLWLNMVLHSLENSSKASKRNFERIINKFPQNLEATYGRFLSVIPSNDREDAARFLRLLIGSSRHLTLIEMNTAFTIDQNHKSAADVVDDLQLSIRSTLQNIVGSFICIKTVNHNSIQDSIVSLIHQSAKEHLTDLALHSADKLVQSLAIPVVDAALSISQSCIRYLLMEEFQSDLLASGRTSIESNSPNSSYFLPFAVSETTSSGGPLGLDDHLGLDEFFKDLQDVDEGKCIQVAREYKFFDYAATHWAERQTPLTISAQYGHLDAVRTLLDDSSTEVTLRGRSGRSALSFAAGNGHFEIVEALLEHGAFRPDDQDYAHWTPLFWAVQGDYAGIVQLLLKQQSIEVNRVDKFGRSVLSWAAGEGARQAAGYGYLDVVRLLVSWEASVHIKNEGGHTAADVARSEGQTEVWEFLEAQQDNEVRRGVDLRALSCRSSLGPGSSGKSF